jgi:hypothetical protein
MTVDTVPRVARAPKLATRGTWSDAEFFDEFLPDGLMLRALVCSAEGGEWQWTVTSLDQYRGELIGVGLEKTAAKARKAAAAEIAKCLDDAMA